MKILICLLVLFKGIYSQERSHACPQIVSFEDGSMMKLLDENAVVFKCNGGFYLHGVEKIKCINGTWSAAFPACRKERPRCTRVQPPENGFIALIQVGSGNNFQLAVKFSCNEGYTVDPSTEEVVFCNSTTGKWSNVMPSCIENKDCPVIPPVVNGTMQTETVTNMGTTVKVVTFSCNSGYELVGPETIRCNTLGTWSSSAPSCQKSRPCVVPTLQNGGHYMVTPQSRAVRVMFWCRMGYNMLGSSYNRCERGTWTRELPRCERNPNCPIPRHEPNVNMRPQSSFYQHRSRVTFSCATSRTELIGSRTLACFHGTWQGTVPVCRVRLCPVPTAPVNGTVLVRGNPAEQQPGSQVSYECNDGLTLFGSKTAQCRTYAYWSSLPTCAVNRTCPDLRPMENGMVKIIGKTYPHVYSRIRIKCNPYYDVHGSSYRTCNPGGVWSGSNPSCRERKSCKDVTSFPNGVVDRMNLTKPYLYTRMSFTCNEGYSLDGSKTLRCQWSRFGPKWSNPIPMCRATHGGCKPITSIPNGKVMKSSGNDVTFLVFSCNDGYNLKGRYLMTCHRNGQWMPQNPPVCQAKPLSKDDI